MNSWKEALQYVLDKCHLETLDIEREGFHTRGYHPETGEILVDWYGRTGTCTIYFE